MGVVDDDRAVRDVGSSAEPAGEPAAAVKPPISRFVNPVTAGVFDLGGHFAAKDDPALTAGDERHLAAIAVSLERSIAEVPGRLVAARREPRGSGQEAMERDQQIHRLMGGARVAGVRQTWLLVAAGG